MGGGGVHSPIGVFHIFVETRHFKEQNVATQTSFSSSLLEVKHCTPIWVHLHSCPFPLVLTTTLSGSALFSFKDIQLSELLHCGLLPIRSSPSIPSAAAAVGTLGPLSLLSTPLSVSLETATLWFSTGFHRPSPHCIAFSSSTE